MMEKKYHSQTSFQNRRHIPVANMMDPIIAVSHDSLNCSEIVGVWFVEPACLPLRQFWRNPSTFPLCGWPFCYKEYTLRVLFNY